MDKYRDQRRDRAGDLRCKDVYKDKSCTYVPPGNRDTKSRMVSMLSRMVKGQESQVSCLKKIKKDFLGLNKKVGVAFYCDQAIRACNLDRCQ